MVVAFLAKPIVMTVAIDLTGFLAIWGAVVATIALVWNIVRDVRDRPRLSVRCFVGRLIEVGVGNARENPREYLIYRVTNAGKLPIVVTHLCGSLDGGGHYFVNSDKVPRQLGPGEYLLAECYPWLEMGAKLKRLYVSDAEGRNHFAPRKQSSEVRKTAEARARDYSR